LGLPFDAQGRAYLFDGRTGALKLTFNNPAPVDLDDFGTALAGGDGRVFIATDGLDDRIYGFSTSDGSLLHTISSPDGRGGNFAAAVAYGSGSVLTSAPSYTIPFGMQSVGRAYLFDAASGLLQRPLPNPEPKTGDAFGIGDSLALFANRALIGAYLDDLPGDSNPQTDNQGRVWVFDRVTGQTVFTLENPNPQKPPPGFLSDAFGRNVAANEYVTVVGAHFDDSSGVDESGTVYVFDSDTGSLRHTLFSPQPESLGGFGLSVALTPGGDVLVGASSTSVDGILPAGHVYLFDGMTGSLLLDIPNPEPGRLGPFGGSVAATADRIFVSLPSAPAVYVYEGIPEPSSLVLGITILVFLLGTVVVQGRKRRAPLVLTERQSMGRRTAL
jgi:outer membrane protein assembly factor BamB